MSASTKGSQALVLICPVLILEKEVSCPGLEQTDVGSPPLIGLDSVGMSPVLQGRLSGRLQVLCSELGLPSQSRGAAETSQRPSTLVLWPLPS